MEKHSFSFAFHMNTLFLPIGKKIDLIIKSFWTGNFKTLYYLPSLLIYLQQKARIEVYTELYT